MKKTILFIFLFSIGLFSSFEAIASGGYTHTHTTPALELKPISFIDNSFKTAAVCFLGVGDCQQGGYDKGDDDMDTDGAKQCQNAGFTRKTCNAVQDPIKNCEHDKNFVTECKCKTNLVTCTSPKFGVGLACGGKYASCQCPATVSMSYPNDRCTQTCDGNCITKTCDKTGNETGCSYGTQSCSDGCGGNTRQCCKAAPPCNSSHPSWCHSCQTCHGDCCTDGTYQSCDTRCGGAGCYTPPPSGSGDHVNAALCESLGYRWIWEFGPDRGCGGHFQQYYIVPTDEYSCPYNRLYLKKGCGVCSGITDSCRSQHEDMIDAGRNLGDYSNFRWFDYPCSWAR